MGGRDHPQNPSWSGERRSPAGCVAPPPALERVLAGALPPPAHVPEHSPCPRGSGNSPHQTWGCRSLCHRLGQGTPPPLLCPRAGGGAGWAIWGETRASPTCTPPIPAAPPAKTLHLQEVDGKIWGQSFRLSEAGCLYPFTGKTSPIQQKPLNLEGWDLHPGGEFVRGRQTQHRLHFGAITLPLWSKMNCHRADTCSHCSLNKH